MPIVAQHNPRRAKALLQLSAGRITVKKAAQMAGVPISGMLGWMKLAGMEIPAEYRNRQNRRPRRREQPK